MAFRFPQPSNEDDFELFCLRFLWELWKCPTLQPTAACSPVFFGVQPS